MEKRESSSRPYTVGSFARKLQLFQKFIEEFTHVDEELNPEERRLQLQERLTNGYEPFCAQINDLFGADVNSYDVKALFRKIAANPEADVDWSELFGIGKTDQEETEPLLSDDGFSVFTVSKRRYLGEAGGDKKRRDFIRNLTYVPKLDIFISSSEKGVVCQWSNKFRLQSCVDINETSWITGCDYCPGLRKIIMSYERSLVIWDYRAKQKQSNVVQIKPLEQTIHCMTYVPWKLDGSSDGDSVLFGDDHGFINVLRLSSKDLHMKNAQNDSETMIVDPEKLTNEIFRRKLHSDWVVKVKYFPQLELFGSCSPCSTTSFVLGDFDKLIAQHPLRELSVPKGVNCFDYCARSNVIATAGADKIIRMWHPLILTRPTGKLIGHLFTISELTVNDNDQHLISLSTARVFRIWDVQTLTCLQVFTSSDFSPSEKRINAMIYDTKRDRLITGCSTIEMWPLTRAIQDSLQLPHTHDRSVSQVLYNSQMKQVVSVCNEPVLKVWEMETGHLVYQIQEPHGPGHEVTAINVNTSGYRLATGGYDGSIKVWDFGSGQLHKSYEPSRDVVGIKHPTITAILYFYWEGKQCLFVASWGQTIRVFEDNVSSDSLQQLISLSDEFIYPMIIEDDVFPTKRPLPAIGESLESITDDSTIVVNLLSTCQVTCLDFMPPRLLLASTTDGVMIIWDVKQRRVIQRFERVESRGTNGRRPSKSGQDSQYKLVHACAFVAGDISRSRDMISIPEEREREDGVVEETSNIVDQHEELRSEREDDLSKHSVDMSEVEFSNERTGYELHGQDEMLKRDDESELWESMGYLGIISAHHDGFIRFWNYEGSLFNELRMIVNQRSSSVTAISHLHRSYILVTADVRGYVMTWDIENFMNTLSSRDNITTAVDVKTNIDQIIYWRAHLNKIVAIEQVQDINVLITASVDSSVRIWHLHTGHFIGFFGQPRLWQIPNTISIPSTPLRPYDIIEAPKKMPRQTKLVNNKSKTNKTVDCPLTFDDLRWRPFRYSAKEETRSSENNKKFFHSLSKPRHYNFHLDSSQSVLSDPAAVFRSLPVYKIEEPERLKTPSLNRSSWLTNPITGTVYAANKPLTTMNNKVNKNVENLISRFPHTVHHKR